MVESRQREKIDAAGTETQKSAKGNKILVCISGSPFSEKLIREARQMAADKKTSWLALYVEKPGIFSTRRENQGMIAVHEQKIIEMGGDVHHLISRHVADEIVNFAKTHQIGHLLIGRSEASHFSIWGSSGLVNRVIHRIGNIPVHVIPGTIDHRRHKRKRHVQREKVLLPYLILTGAIMFTTLLLKGFLPHFDLVNSALLYLLPVLLGAALWGLGPGLYAAALGMASFDFFFVPPYFSLTVADLRYILSFVIFLIAAGLIAALSSGLKRQLKIARENERVLSVLYVLSRKLTFMDDIEHTLQSIIDKVEQTIGGPIAIYIADREGNLTRRVGFSGKRHEREQTVAEWVYKHRRPAGKETDMLGDMDCSFRPLMTEQSICGVLAIYNKYPGTREKIRLLDAVCNLAALAIVRARAQEDGEKARLTAESERLHVVLLDSVSHELRTPLTALIGSATALVENDALFDRGDRLELLETVRKGAIRMNRIVANLLGMVRLESGMLKLNRHWCDVEDMIGVALHQLDEGMQDRDLKIHIDADLPPVFVDEVLFEQALTNVFSNALKYTPEGSPIVIDARVDRGDLYIAVCDSGSGVPEDQLNRIFEKFYRRKETSRITGTGLGLAIVKGIIQAHGGRVSAYNNAKHGLTILMVIGKEWVKK